MLYRVVKYHAIHIVQIHWPDSSFAVIQLSNNSRLQQCADYRLYACLYAVCVASIFPLACAFVAALRTKKKTKRQTEAEIYRERIADVSKAYDGARFALVSQSTKKTEEKKERRRGRESIPDTEMVQCPTGYAPRLFWPGSHFYGFMGTERNLWRPVPI